VQVQAGTSLETSWNYLRFQSDVTMVPPLLIALLRRQALRLYAPSYLCSGTGSGPFTPASKSLNLLGVALLPVGRAGLFVGGSALLADNPAQTHADRFLRSTLFDRLRVSNFWSGPLSSISNNWLVERPLTPSASET